MRDGGWEMTDTTASTFASRLAALLEAPPYGLSRVDRAKLDTLWKKKKDEETETDEETEKQTVVIEPALQIAGYLELTPTLLIADRLLGTLGLVYQLQRDFNSRSETILDQATYLRHLLLMEAGVDRRPLQRAYSVECVLVLPSAEAEQELKQVFRKTARQTSFWHAIGVNVLVVAPDATPDAHSLRRAFSVAAGLDARLVHDPTPPAVRRRLNTITLHNYRLPGHSPVRGP